MNIGTLAVKQGTENINSTGKAFTEIAALVHTVTDEIKGTVAAIHNIESGAKEVAASMGELDRVSDGTASKTQTVSASTQEQTASIEEIAASDALSQLAEKLQVQIVKLRCKEILLQKKNRQIMDVFWAGILPAFYILFIDLFYFYRALFIMLKSYAMHFFARFSRMLLI